jgi:hypothetical protein
MEILKIGCCGDDCNICPRYTATQSGEEKRLEEVSALWKIVGWWDGKKSPKELTCHGCASVSHCDLEIRECVLERSIDNCGQCPEYPCSRLLDIFDNNRKEASICKDQFSVKDYQIFQKAFFAKKERLDQINKEKFNPRKRNIS